MSPDSTSSAAGAGFAAVRELIAELRERREALAGAEREVDRIPDLVEQADRAARAKKAGAGRRRQALAAEAQAIRNRLHNARLDLQETMRSLTVRAGGVAIGSEAGRVVLKRLPRLSPYPSPHAADEALSLLEALLESGPSEAPPAPSSPNDVSETIASLPPDDPSLEDRRVMAELIREAMAVDKHSRKTAQGAIRVSEHTLERLLYPDRDPERPLRKSTWEKALCFVRKTLVDRP